MVKDNRLSLSYEALPAFWNQHWDQRREREMCEEEKVDRHQRRKVHIP
jgi:hypothetical protein